jgi:hypothetical protein
MFRSISISSGMDAHKLKKQVQCVKMRVSVRGVVNFAVHELIQYRNNCKIYETSQITTHFSSILLVF